MKTLTPIFKKYIFVCENSRPEGACCGGPGQRLRERLKAAIKEKGLADKVRVSRSGCLDVCSQGPNVLLMPDNIWFNHVAENDISVIIEKASKDVL